MGEIIENLHDEILVLRSQRGDEGAFKELVSRWQKKLWSRAYRVTQDEEASWDIVQNTWKKVVQELSKLENPTAFSGWILRLTNNLAIDWIRQEVRRRNLHESYAQRIEKSGESPRRRLDDVYVAITQLNPRDCEIITLFYVDEMEISQISEVAGIPAGTVKSRLHHAREKLKIILKEML